MAALDPKGEAARGGIEIDDMVLSINGQTGLSNTEAAAMLRECMGTIVIVVRKCAWLGHSGGGLSVPTPSASHAKSCIIESSRSGRSVCVTITRWNGVSAPRRWRQSTWSVESS